MQTKMQCFDDMYKIQEIKKLWWVLPNFTDATAAAPPSPHQNWCGFFCQLKIEKKNASDFREMYI